MGSPFQEMHSDDILRGGCTAWMGQPFNQFCCKAGSMHCFNTLASARLRNDWASVYQGRETHRYAHPKPERSLEQPEPYTSIWKVKKPKL